MVAHGLSGDWKRKVCPDPEGEHNALVDAMNPIGTVILRAVNVDPNGSLPGTWTSHRHCVQLINVYV